jgi:ribosomal protein RSM22 (predicted rRNA methylase)
MTRVTALAYALTRLPATLGATQAALSAVATAMPSFEPATQLDLACGSGAALLAARAVWPTLALGSGGQVGLDRDPEMLRLAADLTGLPDEMLRRVELGASRSGRDPLGLSADLVTASYSCGELAPADADALVDVAWAATEPTGGVLLLVEPGTPSGAERIRRWRSRLLAAGGHAIAPCPHDGLCPMGERPTDWCHFSARVARSALHRRLKGGSAPYEDEPYSYVALSRLAPASRPAGRVVRHPWRAKGRVELTTCDASGAITERTVTRSDADYPVASRADWGTPLPR